MIKTILLADDSITMQKVIRLTFASGGYELCCADNGDEALKKAEDLKPHIVLVDAALPGKNGYEVCRGIKDNPRLKNTPVIILAGTFNPLDDDKATKAACDDSIVKPFESRQLVEKVENLLRKYPASEATPAEEAITGETTGWAEDDVIRAPEPSPLAGVSSLSFTEETVKRENVPDLEVLEGRGSIEKPDEGITSEQNEEAESAPPKMETAPGELEGEGGFDIEGFEINPFKSEALRDTAPIEERGKGINAWNVEEKDLITFEDGESELEIETESYAGAAAEDEVLIDEPIKADEGPAEDVIEAEEEGVTKESTETLEGEAPAESSNIADEAWICEIVKKISLEIMEGAVREKAPELVQEAVDEAVREKAPELVKEAVEGIAREKAPELVQEAVDEAVREKAPELVKEAVAEIAREKAPELVQEAVAEAVRERAPELVKEAVAEIAREKAPELVKEAVEGIAREKAPELIKEAVEEEMEKIKEAIRGL